jgi:hypothetical protein
MRRLLLFAILIGLSVATVSAIAAGPKRDAQDRCIRYSLPASVLKKPFFFAGELIPVKRPDVESRISSHVNYLLLDARGALTEWLTERAAYSWIFEEIFVKEGIPKEFAMLSPIVARLNSKPGLKSAGAGWWFLDKSCSPQEGVEMSEDAWHDDRLDIELSTKCFAARLKRIHKELGERSWLMTAAAYFASVKTIQEYTTNWNTNRFWDIPLPDMAEELILRWMAFCIISSEREFFELRFADPPPFTFDIVTGVSLKKDLPLGIAAKFMGISPREALELNPKMKLAGPVFPAVLQSKTVTHSIATPKGLGEELLRKLRAEGYLDGVK